MNKLILITRNMKAGGVERVISQLANYFTKKDNECVIITLDNEEVFYKLNSNVKIYPIGKKSTNTYFDKVLKYKELRRYIQKNKPGIEG